MIRIMVKDLEQSEEKVAYNTELYSKRETASIYRQTKSVMGTKQPSQHHSIVEEVSGWSWIGSAGKLV